MIGPSNPRLLAVLAVGAIAAAAIVYAAWLRPADEVGLFSVDRPQESPLPPPPRDGAGPAGPARKAPARPAGATPPAPRGQRSPARVSVAPAGQRSSPPDALAPSDDQYGDSLTRLLARIRN